MHTLDRTTHTEMPLLIVFADLTRYTAETLRAPDQELARTMDAFYERVAGRVEPAGGRVVKFIGDAAFIVFPEADVDRGVQALLDLKEEIDAFFTGLGWECRIFIKAHFGSAIAGPYGGAGDKRFDVLGKAVNRAARLECTGVALSAEAFHKLGPALQKRFKEHTPAATYMRVEDPQPSRRI